MNYGIGGQEVPKEASEGMADIPMNKTLMIEKLTADAPVKAQIVEGLKNAEEVFSHFKPAIDVDFQKEDGSDTKEQLQFRNLGDFGVKGITNQSAYLRDLELQKTEFAKVMKQLKSNKVLKTVLENPDMKAAFITALQAMAQEIEESK